MKQNDILIIVGAAAAAWWLLKNKGGSNTVNNLGAAVNGISEIFTGAASGSPGAGWRYFSDGTSISPAGVYYHNGAPVWTP